MEHTDYCALRLGDWASLTGRGCHAMPFAHLRRSYALKEDTRTHQIYEVRVLPVVYLWVSFGQSGTYSMC